MSTKKDSTEQQLRLSVFKKLDEMFYSRMQNTWGSATYVRNQIRNAFGLTHSDAKDLHEEWASLKDS